MRLKNLTIGSNLTEYIITNGKIFNGDCMKKSIGQQTLVYPHPVFIIGSYDIKNQPNIMAVSWGGICCSKPPCIAISLREATYTHKNIMLNKAFTVNIPSIQYIKEADYVGVVSGKNVDKFKETGLTPIKCETINAPYVEEFPVSLCCELLKTVEIGLHTQFIGEIVDVLIDEKALDENNKPVLEMINPFCYDSATKNYYRTGDIILKGFTTKAL
jgi:flavin reductase (DIM6/NTAB) family NADH-FMN oxidoreductase RutF